jgi:hypothetical protein
MYTCALQSHVSGLFGDMDPEKDYKKKIITILRRIYKRKAEPHTLQCAFFHLSTEILANDNFTPVHPYSASF